MAASGQYPNELPEVLEFLAGDEIIGIRGGVLFRAPTSTLPEGAAQVTVVDNLTSTSTTDALSAKQGKALHDALASKLDASAYVQHYRGKYASLVALETAIPTGLDGYYAIVDTGTGNDAVYYIWDAQDGWVSGGTTTASTTDTVTEGSTNLYFKSSRAISAVTSTINNAVAASLDARVSEKTASYDLATDQADNNDGKTYLRMNVASANTVTIPSTQTKPISIRQAGTGTTTLVADSGVTLNGTLAFTAQHQTKTVIPLGQVGGTGNYHFDIVG